MLCRVTACVIHFFLVFKSVSSVQILKSTLYVHNMKSSFFFFYRFYIILSSMVGCSSICTYITQLVETDIIIICHTYISEIFFFYRNGVKKSFSESATVINHLLMVYTIVQCMIFFYNPYYYRFKYFQKKQYK